MSIYTFITQPYRFSESVDSVVRATYPTARQVELDGYLTNLADADTVAAALFNLLKAPRLMFEVIVQDLGVVLPSAFAAGPPCATLFSNRFNLSAGRLVLVAGVTANLDAGSTTLRCWG